MIPYRLAIEEHPRYLHAKVFGDRTPENARRFLEEVYSACVKSGHSCVLLEMRLSGPSLDALSIFQVISQRAGEGAKLRKIAYVEPLTTDPGKARFAETIAVNRGVNVRLFADAAAAARWLSADHDVAGG